jgi:methyl-accepting chemotaxis protein
MIQTNRKSTEVSAGTAMPVTGQKSFWTVSRKLLFPSIIVMTALVLGLIIYVTIFNIQRNQSEATRDLTRTNDSIKSNIDGLQTLALGLSTELAVSPQVESALAAQDRQLLTELTLPTFEVIQKDFDVKQLQFILPPAISFLRLHQLDQYGDDLSAFRFTAVEANATQKPVSGIEIGRGGLGVRGETPVFYEGKYIGIIDVGLDIGSTYLKNLKKEYGADVQILLEKKAAEIATFTGSTTGSAGPIPSLLFQSGTFDEPLYASPAAYERVLNGETVVTRVNSKGRTYSIISAPLKDYAGNIIGVLEVALDRTEVIATQFQSLALSIFISLVITIAGVVILTRLINYTLKPINTLTETAAALAGGDFTRQTVIQSEDEFGVLADAFNHMTSQLRDFIATLEARIADRTRNLELAAEVGGSVSQVRALDVMLKDAAELIRKQFDLYYVQVYLADPSQTNLILQSGTGSVGAELVGRGHRLPLNTASINGRAAVEKKSVVISDTAASPTFKPNPLLPNTRSEMAVPLLIGNKVVGVLDMQSEHSGSLSTDILSAFEALAGQLAIAIQNANFLAETNQARAEVEAQAKRLTRANWVDYLDAVHKPEEIGFMFEQNKIAPLAKDGQTKDNALIAPITVTGESLGNLVVEMESQSPISRTSELVDTVARQVSQQIESLRLLDSAERYRAEAEEASRRITREGWQDYMDKNAGESLSYIYDLKEVRPFNAYADQQAGKSAFQLPIKVRDEVVGKLIVQDLEDKDSEALDLANAVAERLGAHIEGLRLSKQTEQALAMTQKQTEREQALRQITNAVRSSTDPATILRSAARELGTLLGRKTIVRLATADQTEPSNPMDENGSPKTENYSQEA